jgi:hypothetical protein
MTIWDTAGYLASSLVITAFCMKDILRLRLAALVSNVAFLIYGLGLGLAPVWLLHAILLPVNLWRLWQYVSRDPFPVGEPRTRPSRATAKHPLPQRYSIVTFCRRRTRIGQLILEIQRDKWRANSQQPLQAGVWNCISTQPSYRKLMPSSLASVFLIPGRSK